MTIKKHMALYDSYEVSSSEDCTTAMLVRWDTEIGNWSEKTDIGFERTLKKIGLIQKLFQDTHTHNLPHMLSVPHTIKNVSYNNHYFNKQDIKCKWIIKVLNYLLTLNNVVAVKKINILIRRRFS
jgi:hypothetical protein